MTLQTENIKMEQLVMNQNMQLQKRKRRWRILTCSNEQEAYNSEDIQIENDISEKLNHTNNDEENYVGSKDHKDYQEDKANEVHREDDQLKKLQHISNQDNDKIIEIDNNEANNNKQGDAQFPKKDSLQLESNYYGQVLR